MLVVLVVLAAGLGSTAAQALQNPYLTGNRTTCPYRYNGHAFVVCSGQGRCVPPGECVCAVGFRGNDCSYALRSRRTAFTLSFLLGNWGAGRLYMGLIGTGVLKLMLMMLLMAMPCFPMCCMCVTYEQRKLRLLYRVVVGASAIGMLAIFVWWTYDWLMILDPGSLDYLGLPLVADIGM